MSKPHRHTPGKFRCPDCQSDTLLAVSNRNGQGHITCRQCGASTDISGGGSLALKNDWWEDDPGAVWGTPQPKEGYYACPHCHEVAEVLVAVDLDGLITCGRCQARATGRQARRLWWREGDVTQHHIPHVHVSREMLVVYQGWVKQHGMDKVTTTLSMCWSTVGRLLVEEPAFVQMDTRLASDEPRRFVKGAYLPTKKGMNIDGTRRALTEYPPTRWGLQCPGCGCPSVALTSTNWKQTPEGASKMTDDECRRTGMFRCNRCEAEFTWAPGPEGDQPNG